METGDRAHPREQTAADRGEEAALLAALRAGDERAFERLVELHHASLVRVARQYVPTQEIAEDVAQEAWVGLLRGLDKFEGRSSLRTYLFRIVMNLARTRGVREARSAPFSSLVHDDEDGPAVDPERFVQRARSGRRPLGLADPPVERERRVDRALGGGGAAGSGGDRELPEMQRRVVTLRDVEGFGADEVSDLLELSDGNQRVLLHRARTKLREALAEYYA